MYNLMLYETEIVGGLVGDTISGAGNALQSVTDAICQGLLNGFKCIVLTGALVIEKLSGIGIVGQEIVYYASKENRDKGKIVKYILIFLGSIAVEMMISAI